MATAADKTYLDSTRQLLAQQIEANRSRLATSLRSPFSGRKLRSGGGSLASYAIADYTDDAVPSPSLPPTTGSPPPATPPPATPPPTTPTVPKTPKKKKKKPKLTTTPTSGIGGGVTKKPKLKGRKVKVKKPVFERGQQEYA